MKKLGVGIIGHGARGYTLTNITAHSDKAEVVAICDILQQRLDEANERVNKVYGHKVKEYIDYRELVDDPNVDVVLVCTPWEEHVPMGLYCMEKGKPCGIEVGGAYSLDDCWRLVRTYERTKTPFMMLENCCFGKRELMVTAATRKGLLGDIVYCHGAYGHDLRKWLAEGVLTSHYRSVNYIKRNSENYPTHELGPIAKLMNINRGNTMVSLSSVATCAKGLNEYAHLHEEVAALKEMRFAQGDVITTTITCADGAVITLKLDTTLPRAYSREFSISGTLGCYVDPGDILLVTRDGFDDMLDMNDYRGNAAKYEDELLAPAWKSITPEMLEAGHGGMDGIMLDCFYKSILDKVETPLDVYDTAAWMAVSTLSEASIRHGGAPVQIPDFTCGRWSAREKKDVIDLGL